MLGHPLPRQSFQGIHGLAAVLFGVDRTEKTAYVFLGRGEHAADYERSLATTKGVAQATSIRVLRHLSQLHLN
jgi:hypothetical protein